MVFRQAKRGGLLRPKADYRNLDLFVVRVDHTVVAGLAGILCAAAAAVAAAVRIRIALRSRVLVKLLRNRIERLLHFVGRGLDGGNVGALLGFLQLFDRGQNQAPCHFR